MSVRAEEWRTLRPLVREVESILHEDPALAAQADGLGVTVREALDESGVCIADEQSLYTVLVTGLLFQRLLLNGAARGLVGMTAIVEHRRCFHSLIAAVLPHIPEEAR